MKPSDFIDGFETESSFQPIQDELEPITAIKFEIEYGEDNNCFFDSTQDRSQTIFK